MKNNLYHQLSKYNFSFPLLPAPCSLLPAPLPFLVNAYVTISHKILPSISSVDASINKG